jgi:hypothetical protein
MADAEDNIGGNTEETKEVTFTAAEEKAMEQGWVPENEWEGDPDKWRPAKEFLDRGELFKKIDDQNRSLKQVKQALEDLSKHHAKVRETEYARALDSLKAQKVTALEEGDAAAVVKLDDQIDLVKDAQTQLKLQPTGTQEPAQVNPEFTNWMNRNKWYESDDGMRGWADAVGRRLAATGLSPSAVLAEVEKQIKTEFPNKFRNPNRDKPGSVEGSSSKGGKAKDDYALSDDENRAMQRFIKTIPGFSKETYIAELKALDARRS